MSLFCDLMVISRDLIGIYSDEMGDFMDVFNQQIILVPFSGRYTVILAGYPYHIFSDIYSGNSTYLWKLAHG